MALAPLIIRLGADASSDVLRRCARCTICGHKGATLKHPGWKNGGRVGAVPHRHDDTHDHALRPRVRPFGRPCTEAPSGRQELLFNQGAERVGSLTAATRPPDDPFGLRSGNSVLSSKVADLIGLTTSHPAAPRPASIRSVIKHKTLLGPAINSQVVANVPLEMAFYPKSYRTYPKVGGVLRRSDRDDPEMRMP